jgi:predicted nucleic acid-binding protein
VDAFDADVLIYASEPGQPLGERVWALLTDEQINGPEARERIGSVLLVPELLSKPIRIGAEDQLDALGFLLSRLDLLAVDRATADLAASLGAAYRLRAADAVHLATAVSAGADRFITDNRRDFPLTISDIAITYPDHLPDQPGAGR